MANVYFGGRNFDGTGFSPLYYNDYYTTLYSGNTIQGQFRFINPYSTNGAKSMTIDTASPTATTLCDGTSTTLYPVTGLYIVVDTETKRLFVTNGGSSPPDSRYSQAYIGVVSSQLVLMMKNKVHPVFASNYVYYAQSTDSDFYINASLQTSAQCTNQQFVGGAPIVADGVVWLVDPASSPKFYTTAVNGPSFYALTTNTIPSDLQNALVSIPSGTTAELYFATLLGTIPNSTTAVSNTPASSSGSSTALTPDQVAAIKKKSQQLSFWTMFGIFMIFVVIIIIILIIFLVTQPKKYPRTVPVLYDEKDHRVFDLPAGNIQYSAAQSATNVAQYPTSNTQYPRTTAIRRAPPL